MTYGLWAFELRGSDNSVLPALSMAPFILAVLRYAVDVDAGTASEPEEIALRDRVLQVLALAGWPSSRLAVYRLTAASVSGFVPAVAGADGDVERDGQVGRAGHLLADQLLERVALAVGHLEHELVVDLEQHP